MNAVNETARYHSPLRERQKAETRRSILEAVGRVVESLGSFEKLSVGAVAREAGVRERTVYRHFRSRDALVDAFFAFHTGRMGIRFPESEDDLLAHGERLFPVLEEYRATTRAFMHSQAGREVFVRLGPAYRARFEAAVAEAAAGLGREEKRWLAAAANALVSNATWQVLHDRWEMSGREAGAAARFAVGMLLGGARARGLARRRSRAARRGARRGPAAKDATAPRARKRPDSKEDPP